MKSAESGWSKTNVSLNDAAGALEFCLGWNGDVERF